jgi:hypothetical protein
MAPDAWSRTRTIGALPAESKRASASFRVASVNWPCRVSSQTQPKPMGATFSTMSGRSWAMGR